MKAVRKVARRVYSPFDVPDRTVAAISGTKLVVSDTALGDKDDLRLAGPLPEPPHFVVHVNARAIAELCDAWSLEESELAVVALVEVEFLKEIQVERRAPSRTTDLEWTVPLSPLVREALGRSDVTFSAYLVLANAREPGRLGEPFQKGHILTRWRSELQAPTQAFRFTPRLLDSDSRNLLEGRFGRRISAETTLLVYTDGLLGEGDLDDCLEVYIHPEVADYLDSANATEAKAVEGMILWSVVEEILRGVRDELKEQPGRLIPDGAPVRSLLVSLQEAAGIETLEELVEMICNDPRSYAAIATFTQELAGLLEATT